MSFSSFRRKNRLGALFTFVLLVVVGRQFTPHSSSASDWTAPVLSPPPDQAVRHIAEPLQTGPAPRFRVVDSRGRVLAEGLTSSQLAYHFPNLNPGPAVRGFNVDADQGR